jgi:hypothetical protein
MSPAADRGYDIDTRVSAHGCLEHRALVVDVHVDVTAQGGAGLAQPVAEPGPALVQPFDRLRDRLGLELDATGQAGEDRGQGAGQVDGRHRYANVATSTEEIAGR